MDQEDQIPLDDDRAPESRDEIPGDDTFELEVDGQTHVLPVALKGAFLRQADYTRKTQELAQHRRDLAAEREALAHEVAAHRSASADQLRLAALDHQLEDLRGVDWTAYAAKEPEAARSLWDAFQRLGAAREQLAAAVAHHGEKAELAAARHRADAMAETGRQLAREIDGWSPELAAKLVAHAGSLGVTPDELAEAGDPRLWKLLHRSWRADAAERAAAPSSAPDVRPAVSVSGGGGAPSGVRDDLATREWMRRRNAQMSGGR